MNNKDFLDIHVPQLLQKLNPEQTPVWGQMSAQHMVEHLETLFAVSNGKIRTPANAEPEKLAHRKQRFFASEAPFPRDFKLAELPATPAPYRHIDLTTAIAKMTKEYQRFLQFFEQNKGAITTHPYFGDMDYEEWLAFHKRHISHHFAQFNLL